jgi:hypothetical protein
MSAPQKSTTHGGLPMSYAPRILSRHRGRCIP